MLLDWNMKIFAKYIKIFAKYIKGDGITAFKDILKAFSYTDFFVFKEINIRIKAILELKWSTV